MAWAAVVAPLAGSSAAAAAAWLRGDERHALRWSTAALSIVLFLGVRTTTADMIGSCCGNRPALDKLDRTKLKGGLLELKNLWTSLVHAAVSGCLSLWVVGSAVGAGGWYSLYDAGDDVAALSASVTMGYLVVDVFDAAATGQLAGKRPVVAHHALLLVGLCISNHVVLGERLLQLGVVCELNSVFLHLRAMMRVLGWTWADAPYQGAWAGVWLTLIAFRFGAHGAMAALLAWDPRAFVEDSGIGAGLAAMIAIGLFGFLAFDAALAVALRAVMGADLRRARKLGAMD